jgi:hypothetical protein
MKESTKNGLFKLAGIGLFLLSLAFSHLNCGTASDCGGTETGNPTTCTTQDAPTTGEDSGSTADDSQDDDAGDSDSFDADSDNDLSADVSINDPFIETLALGDDADLNIGETVVIFDNESDFAAFWEEFFGSAEDGAEAIPKVDFSTRIVAAAAMGSQENGGFSIAFTDQRIEDGTMILTLTETRPGANCNVAASFTNPYHVISVPVSGEEIAIETETVEVDCE